MSSAPTLTLPSTLRASTASVRPALAGVDDARVQAAFASCAEVVRQRARNFYYGLRLTPEPRRSAVYSIYAWMRFGDDQVDEPTSPAQKHAALARFAALTERVLAGELPDGEPFWAAFAATLRSYPIEHAHIRAMLAGLEADIEHGGYATIEDLESYCYHVASTVGLVCVAIWGFRAGVTLAQVREAGDLALRRGKAFQLTNILRDFAEDFDQGRVYLPTAALAEHGLTPPMLRRWERPEQCAALVRSLARRARAHYDASAPLDELIDAPCRSTLYAMTRIYTGLLEVIEAEPARVVGTRRIRLTSRAKAFIAASALVRGGLNIWPASATAGTLADSASEGRR
ncbi:presqualene diphosphate synthase HpnD [soil metagenome]